MFDENPFEIMQLIEFLLEIPHQTVTFEMQANS
jgi:hypothetical protein